MERSKLYLSNYMYPTELGCDFLDLLKEYQKGCQEPT